MQRSDVKPEIKIVVFDDDPTGTQTVHGCLMLTDWREEIIRRAFADDTPFFYILTNTRSRTADKAESIVREAVNNVLLVNGEWGYRLILISRSDSTLRSHFPLEIDVIVDSYEAHLGKPVDAVFLIPAFFEGGRITCDDIHYALENGRRVPVADTEFARDSVFGYANSHLPSYIEEKTRGRIKAGDVESISLDTIRNDPDSLDEWLENLRNRRYVVVNSESYDDLEIVASKLRESVLRGKRFVFQSAASIVKSLSQVPDKPLLSGEIALPKGNGLFIVGSHVRKTTRQLNLLLADERTVGIEADVSIILKSPSPLRESILSRVRETWQRDQVPVVYTSREELRFASKEARLLAGEKISRFLVDLVGSIEQSPSYLVAKGGITSHDVLVGGIGVKFTRVLGQILPGVPVISVPEGNRFAGMPYVIFPGNVGDDDALVQILNIFDSGV